MAFRLTGSTAKQILLRRSSKSAHVPKGFLALYVGETEKKRFVVPVSYLNQPSFQDLLRKAGEEFGFDHPMGGLTIPCGEDTFIHATSRLSRRFGVWDGTGQLEEFIKERRLKNDVGSSWIVIAVKNGSFRGFGTKMRYPYQSGNIMNVVQNLMERLRPFVGPKGWDYCVLWKLSEDQRYIDLMDCCCAGTTEGTQNGGELQFPVSPVLSCRDVMFQHPRTKSCELLAELPSSMPLHPGNIHAQTLISNLPRWLNLDLSAVPGEMVGTKALIPVPGGLMELFITKQVPEDQHVIDVVTSQCNFLMEQEAMINPTNMDSSSFSIDMNALGENQSKPFLADAHEQKDDINCSYQPPAAISSQTTVENLNLPYDISLDRLHMSCSPMNVLQQFNYSANEETKTKNEVFLDTDALQKSIVSNSESMQMQYVESALTSKDQQGNDKESLKLENGPSADSHSECNDQIDEEDDVNYRRRNGKGPQSKNLVAERKRRRKLNDRLYALRSLVPKISKLDRASILGDAIEFIKELKVQEKELQDELDEHSDNEDENQNGVNLAACKPEISLNGFRTEGSSGITFSKLNQDSETTHHNKAHQMEPQVEVSQIDGNKFFVEVFCERKPGGFVKLVGFLDSLGLEVTNTNVTSNTGLVFYVLKAKRKEDNEMVQADYVRDSLLEFTRDPQSGGWPEMPNDSEDHTAMDYSHHYHHHHLHNGHINSNHHHLHHFHN